MSTFQNTRWPPRRHLDLDQGMSGPAGVNEVRTAPAGWQRQGSRWPSRQDPRHGPAIETAPLSERRAERHSPPSSPRPTATSSPFAGPSKPSPPCPPGSIAPPASPPPAPRPTHFHAHDLEGGWSFRPSRRATPFPPASSGSNTSTWKTSVFQKSCTTPSWPTAAAPRPAPTPSATCCAAFRGLRRRIAFEQEIIVPLLGEDT